jgi:hypothetical protein
MGCDVGESMNTGVTLGISYAVEGELWFPLAAPFSQLTYDGVSPDTTRCRSFNPPVTIPQYSPTSIVRFKLFLDNLAVACMNNLVVSTKPLCEINHAKNLLIAENRTPVPIPAVMELNISASFLASSKAASIPP